MHAALLSGVLAGLLAGCASAPRPTPEPAPASAPASAQSSERLTAAEQAALATLQADQRSAARQAQRDGRHAAAQQAWSVVLALDAGDAEAQGGVGQALRAAAEAARDSLRRADQARARGDREGAMRLYLEALAQDATLDSAADALRTLEAERGRRGTPQNFVRPSRPAPAGSSRAPGPPELEHADLLVEQGEVDAALLLLEPLARKPQADAAVKRRVCELLLRQAEPGPGVADDAEKAMPLVQRCLRLLPQHAPALQRQRALRGAGPSRR